MHRLLPFLLLTLACEPSQEPEGPLDPIHLIQQAGEAEDDRVRHELLAQAERGLGADHPLAFEINDLVAIADQWANGRELLWEPGDQERGGEQGYLGGFFVDLALPSSLGSPYPAEPELGSVLHPIWALYRGRMLIWSAIENGVAEESFFEEGRELLAEARVAFPSNRVIGMYLDEPMPWPLPPVAWDGAPEWAQLQSQALAQLEVILRFWIRERQAPDGQFGGGWGDDVEMWRWWAPLLLGFENSDFQAANRALGEGIFALPRLEGGYSNILADVEHSGEDTADTITPALLMNAHDAQWRRRAFHIAELAGRHWLAANDKGRLQFQSTYFTHERSSTASSQACDTAYHVRALQPALLAWFQSGDSGLEARLLPWLQTWAQAVSEAGGGKPAGVLPAAIRFPSGGYTIDDKDWWNPGCHFNEKTFRFPRAQTLMVTALVQAQFMTQDPLITTALETLVAQQHLALQGQLDGEAEGEAGWAAAQSRGAVFKALAKWRVASGDSRYDELLRSHGSSYLRSLLFADVAGLVAPLRNTVAALAQDGPAVTSEVRFTDRVLGFHKKYAAQFRGPQSRVDTGLLYSMLSGDPGDPNVLPLGAVRWRTGIQGFAARVTVNESQRLGVELVNLSKSPKAVGASLLRLEPGSYPWSLSCGGAGRVEVGPLGGSLDLTLPGQSTCTLLID